MEEFLEKVDVIHVCTHPLAHEPIAIAALERDKFAIVEKPLTGYFGGGSCDQNVLASCQIPAKIYNFILTYYGLR